MSRASARRGDRLGRREAAREQGEQVGEALVHVLRTEGVASLQAHEAVNRGAHRSTEMYGVDAGEPERADDSVEGGVGAASDVQCLFVERVRRRQGELVTAGVVAGVVAEG